MTAPFLCILLLLLPAALSHNDYHCFMTYYVPVNVCLQRTESIKDRYLASGREIDSAQRHTIKVI